MRNKNLFLLLLVLIPLCGCSHMEYDTFRRLDKEVTLFEEGIAVPVGNVGPITVASLLNGSQIGTLVSQFVKEGDDGVFYIESEEEIFNGNVYELALKIPDRTQPYRWEIGTRSASIGGMSSMLAMFGLCIPHQMLIVQEQNPIMAELKLNAKARMSCTASDYSTSYTQEIDLTDFAVPSYYSARTLVQFDIPEDVTDRISMLELEDLTLDLPKNVADKVRSGNNCSFVISSKYKGSVAVGSAFKMTQTLPINNLKVEIGKFKLRQCQVSFDLENSLPLDVTLDSVKFLDKDGKVNPDIVFSSGVKISGGTVEKPVTTPVTLEVKATDGSIPDITGVEITVTIQAPEGKSGVPLSSRMGLAIKSATATLRGGITLFGNEK